MPSKRLLKQQKATIEWLADDNTSIRKTSQTTSNASKDVIDRVRKCFARAEHSNANEAEARAAVKMASKIMEQHQIRQSDLMEAEDQSQRETRGGLSTVNIWPATDSSRAFNQVWVGYLVGAMTRFFDCKAYSTHHGKEMKQTFYGVAEHTLSAAIAFEAIHNQIQDWAQQYKGVTTRNSYCLGVTDGLITLAEQEKKVVEEKARQYETKALAARIREENIKQQVMLHRLRQPSPERHAGSETEDAMDVDDEDDHNNTSDHGGIEGQGDADDVSDNEAPADFNENPGAAAETVDTRADFVTELRKFIVPESAPATNSQGVPSRAEYLDEDLVLPSTEEGGEAIDIEETAEWKSMRQLSTYREMSKDIEASVLKAQKVKLRKGRKLKRSVKDKEAFKKGMKDSKKIEVRAARIEQNKDQNVVESAPGASEREIDG